MKEKHFINIVTCLLYIPAILSISYSIIYLGINKYSISDLIAYILAFISISWLVPFSIVFTLDIHDIGIRVPYFSNYKDVVTTPSYSVERGHLSDWDIIKHELGWGSNKEYVFLPLLNLFKFRGLYEVDRIGFNGNIEELEDLEAYYEEKMRLAREEYEKETTEHNKVRNKMNDLNNKYNSNLK